MLVVCYVTELAAVIFHILAGPLALRFIAFAWPFLAPLLQLSELVSHFFMALPAILRTRAQEFLPAWNLKWCVPPAQPAEITYQFYFVTGTHTQRLSHTHTVYWLWGQLNHLLSFTVLPAVGLASCICICIMSILKTLTGMHDCTEFMWAACEKLLSLDSCAKVMTIRIFGQLTRSVIEQKPSQINWFLLLLHLIKRQTKSLLIAPTHWQFMGNLSLVKIYLADISSYLFEKSLNAL